MGDYNYSIIIPFRGNDECLYIALASIPDRTDIQVIVVDDNERPHSIKNPFSSACCELIVPQVHKGAGHARNEALGIAKGRYVIFCDADDFFSENAFSVFDRHIDDNSDITFFGVDCIRLVDGRKGRRHLRKNCQIRSFLLHGKEDGLRYRWDAPWGKMYKRAFISSGGFLFDETEVSNDDIFSVQCGHNAVSISADKERVYVVTDGRGFHSSLTSRSREKMFINYCVHLRKLVYLAVIGRKDLCRRLWMHNLRAFFFYGPTEYLRYKKREKEVRIW